MEGIEKAVTEKATKKFKPTVSIGVSVDTVHSGPPGIERHDWRKEEHGRLVSEVKALEHELSSFDPKKAAEKIKQSLEIKLKLRKLRLEECKLKLDGGMNGGGGIESY